MKPVKGELEKLEQALQEAHRQKTPPVLGDSWRQEVMAAIRALPEPRTDDGAAARPWLPFIPLASAAGLAAAALLMLATTTLTGLEYEVVRLLLEETAGLPTLLLTGL